MSIPNGLIGFLNSDFAKVLVGASKDYFLPYVKKKLEDAMEPVVLSDEDKEKQADEHFPPATGDDWDVVNEDKQKTP